MRDRRSDRLRRHHVLRASAAAGTPDGETPAEAAEEIQEEPLGERVATRGRIRQSVVSWCYEPMPLATLARHAAAMGIQGIENVEPKDWGILKRHGLVCAMTVAHGFIDGMNRKENHPLCIEKLTKAIEANGVAGFPNVITFSGMRKGMSDDVGLANTVAGLKQVIRLAERNKVNLCLEVLNTRVDEHMKGHPDYMGDRVEWAVEVCKRIGSERMKILFDIYHVQIMQGDIITRIRKYHEYVGHYHVAGVPGRAEIDDTQEIYYPAIMRAILATGYRGFVGQEFIPTRDPMQSLREAVTLCDV
jgi:hydroxypyruvate isomerase